MPSLMPCCQVPRINAEMHHHKQLFCTWGQATVCTVQAHAQEAPKHTQLQYKKTLFQLPPTRIRLLYMPSDVLMYRTTAASKT